MARRKMLEQPIMIEGVEEKGTIVSHEGENKWYVTCLIDTGPYQREYIVDGVHVVRDEEHQCYFCPIEHAELIGGTVSMAGIDAIVAGLTESPKTVMPRVVCPFCAMDFMYEGEVRSNSQCRVCFGNAGRAISAEHWVRIELKRRAGNQFMLWELRPFLSGPWYRECNRAILQALSPSKTSERNETSEKLLGLDSNGLFVVHVPNVDTQES